MDDGQGGLEVTFDNTASGGANGGGSHSGSNGSGSGSGGSNGSDSNGDNGGGGGGIVTESFTGVEEVVFLGLAGDDTFTYELTGPLTTDLDLNLLMGRDNNSATIDASAGIEAGATLVVDVKGNGGDDDFAIDVGDIGDDATFDLVARLGGGDDLFSLIEVGDIGAGASVSTRVEGAGGNDAIDASVEGNVAEGAEVDLRFNGGIGNDTIDLSVEGDVAADALLDIRSRAPATTTTERTLPWRSRWRTQAASRRRRRERHS